MKPILATDLAGSLLKNSAVEKAHHEWFKVMAFLLKDDSVRKFAGKPDFFNEMPKCLCYANGLTMRTPLGTG